MGFGTNEALNAEKEQNTEHFNTQQLEKLMLMPLTMSLS
jgi:hypothetical protein